jgi:acetylornithine/N-succinyldiaminopimelate aminotransferase
VCDEVGALMVCDEVQSGIGRAGSWLMSVDQGVVPDLVTLAKGLASGMPIGAVIATGEAQDVLVPGDHGTTFGGNPVSCAAALAVLDTVEAEGLLQHVVAVGDRWGASFDALGHPLLASHRGVGLWRALELAEPVAPAFEAAARKAGFLVNAVRPTSIRLAPPLVLSMEQADQFTAALPSLLDAAGGA